MPKMTTLFLLCSLLAGCSVHQDVHRLSSSVNFFTLDHQETFSIAGDLSAEKHIFISSGVYEATHESLEGTYYKGPTDAVRIEGKEITVIAQGGIYLSKKIDEPAKTWVYSKSLQRYVKGDTHISTFVEIAKGLVNETEISLLWDIPETMKAKIQLQHAR